jgi:hypothetical protein
LTFIFSIQSCLKIPGGNQILYIEEQTRQWRPKEKVQKDKQQSTKHTHKTKDRVTQPNNQILLATSLWFLGGNYKGPNMKRDQFLKYSGSSNYCVMQLIL